MGRDCCRRCCCGQSSCFNPRAHVGRDMMKSSLFYNDMSFNPRAHVGRDLLLPLRVDDCIPFQSTRPRGARHAYTSLRVHVRCFNPRAHVGRDEALITRCLVSMVSIHAPTWGATGSTPKNVFGMEFQSTRPRGARRPSLPRGGSRMGFNPRAHVGRDSFGTLIIFCRFCFNPRAHVGRDSAKRCFTSSE